MDWSVADTAWVTSARPPDPVAGGDSGSRWAAVVLNPDTTSVAMARRWARETVEAWDADSQEWTVSQLLTEVVTNAVLHADTRFRVRLEQDLGTRRLRCEVTDASGVRPRLRNHSTEATTGRGLKMVADLAQGWGVVPLDGGKTVWFEVGPDADLRLWSDGGFAAEPWLASLDAAAPASPPGPHRTPEGVGPGNRAHRGGSPSPGRRAPAAGRRAFRPPHPTAGARGRPAA